MGEAAKKAAEEAKKATARDMVAKSWKAESNNKMEKMREAIELGEAAGLPESELAQVRKAVAALEVVAKSWKDADYKMMREAVDLAKAAGLPESDYEHVKEAAEKEEQRQSAEDLKQRAEEELRRHD